MCTFNLFEWIAKSGFSEAQARSFFAAAVRQDRSCLIVPAYRLLCTDSRTRVTIVFVLFDSLWGFFFSMDAQNWPFRMCLREKFVFHPSPHLQPGRQLCSESGQTKALAFHRKLQSLHWLSSEAIGPGCWVLADRQSRDRTIRVAQCTPIVNSDSSGEGVMRLYSYSMINSLLINSLFFFLTGNVAANVASISWAQHSVGSALLRSTSFRNMRHCG